MGILWKDPYTEKKFFDSRYKLLTQLWAWLMRRRGYDTNYIITHLGPTRYFVIARRRPKKGDER